MNIQYPVSEILRCVDYINDPKKEIYESSNETLVLNNPLTMKKKTKEINKSTLIVQLILIVWVGSRQLVEGTHAKVRNRSTHWVGSKQKLKERAPDAELS